MSAAAALDSEVSIDGGAFADCTNEAAEITGARGVYTLLLTAAEMNGDIITTITISTTSNSKDAVNVMYTVTRQLVDLAFPTVSGRSVDVTATGAVGVDFDNIEGTLDAAEIGAAAITAAKFAAGAIDAAAIANAAIDAATFAAGAIDAAAIANAAIDAATFAAGAIDAAAIATDAIDADAIAADAVTELRGALANGTADAGGTSTTMVDAARTEADDVWNGAWILFTSGAVANQARLITDFDAVTDTITFAPAATAAIGAGITYEILPNAAVDLQSWVGLVTALQTPNALVAGAVDADVSAIQANAITAAAIATDAIDADAIAADAIGAAEIANGAIDAATFAAGAIDAAAIANGAIDAATFAASAIDDAAIAADAFDGLFIRDIDQVEASAPVHSLTTAVLKAVSRIRDNAGTLEVYRTNGITIHMSQTVTTDAANDPIDELTAGV